MTCTCNPAWTRGGNHHTGCPLAAVPVIARIVVTEDEAETIGCPEYGCACGGAEEHGDERVPGLDAGPRKH